MSAEYINFNTGRSPNPMWDHLRSPTFLTEQLLEKIRGADRTPMRDQ